MTLRTLADFARCAALGTLMLGAAGYSDYQFALLVTGSIGVLVTCVWRLRLEPPA